MATITAVELCGNAASQVNNEMILFESSLLLIQHSQPWSWQKSPRCCRH